MYMCMYVELVMYMYLCIYAYVYIYVYIRQVKEDRYSPYWAPSAIQLAKSAALGTFLLG